MPPDVRFKTKMHHIRFPLGLDPPQTPLGELTALPRPLAVFKGPTSKGRGKGEGEEKRKGDGREGELGRKGRDGNGK